MEQVYADRNSLAQLAVVLANRAGIPAGIRVPIEDPEWPVVVIVLPEVGEVAWHIPANELHLINNIAVPFDGHTNEEKQRRIAEFIEAHSKDSIHEDRKRAGFLAHQ